MAKHKEYRKKGEVEGIISIVFNFLPSFCIFNLFCQFDSNVKCKYFPLIPFNYYSTFVYLFAG